MPQLMPLLWVLSNCILFIILMVITSIYSMSYFNLMVNKGNAMKKNSLDWWW